MSGDYVFVCCVLKPAAVAPVSRQSSHPPGPSAPEINKSVLYLTNINCYELLK